MKYVFACFAFASLFTTGALAADVSESPLGPVVAIKRTFPIDIDKCMETFKDSSCQVAVLSWEQTADQMIIGSTEFTKTYSISEEKVAKVYVIMGLRGYSVLAWAKEGAWSQEEKKEAIRATLESLPSDAMSIKVFKIDQ